MKIGGSSEVTSAYGEYSAIQGRILSRPARNSSNWEIFLAGSPLKPKAWPPYLLLGVQSVICCGSSVVCAPPTAAHQSRVDSWAMGSELDGSAISGWKSSQRLEQAPAEPPEAPMRALSMFHSPALLRT